MELIHTGKDHVTNQLGGVLVSSKYSYLTCPEWNLESHFNAWKISSDHIHDIKRLILISQSEGGLYTFRPKYIRLRSFSSKENRFGITLIHY